MANVDESGQVFRPYLFPLYSANSDGDSPEARVQRRSDGIDDLFNWPR